MNAFRAMSLLVACALLLGCQTTVSNVKPLLDRSGTGTTTLPSFTSKGTYDVAYAYDTCTGGVIGMTIEELVGSDPKPVTLLQTVVPDGSGNIAGRKAGTITLKITTHCHWKITVTG